MAYLLGISGFVTAERVGYDSHGHLLFGDPVQALLAFAPGCSPKHSHETRLRQLQPRRDLNPQPNLFRVAHR